MKLRCWEAVDLARRPARLTHVDFCCWQQHDVLRNFLIVCYRERIRGSERKAEQRLKDNRKGVDMGDVSGDKRLVSRFNFGVQGTLHATEGQYRNIATWGRPFPRVVDEVQQPLDRRLQRMTAGFV